MTTKLSKTGAGSGSALGGMKGRSAASALFYEELPEELRPSSSNRALSINLVWGDTIIETKQFRKGQATIGGADGTDFKVYMETLAKHTLATIEGDNATLEAPAGGEIIVRTKDGKESSGTSMTIGFDDVARVKLGNVELVVRFVRTTGSEKTGFFEGVDLYFTKILSIAVMIHVAILLALMITPIGTDSLAGDLFRQHSRFTQLILDPLEEARPKLDMSKAEEEPQEEIEFGVKEDAPVQESNTAVDASKREEDIKKVRNTGLLAAMGGDGSSNIFGGGGLGAGVNNALGGLQAGAGMGEAHGAAGLGTRGMGPGGGGGGLGIGGVGTRGGGGGRGGGITLGGGNKRTTRIVPGRTTVVGGLDRSVIADVIRRHQNQIRFCYERELQKDPGLEGRVSVQFTIDGSGGISQVIIQEDSVGGSGAVGRCINQRIRRWRFPEPQGGGEVIVTYPWNFRSTGE